MTLEKIIQEIFEALGEPSDLQYLDDSDAIDTASTGWLRMVDAVNTACLEIATHKFPEGRQLRFRFLEEQTQLVVPVLSGTIASHTAGEQLVTLDLPLQAAGYYKGYALAIGTSNYRVIDSQTSGAATQALLFPAPQTSVASLGYMASRREYYFVDASTLAFGEVADGIAYVPANGLPLEILNVHDITNATEITYTSRHTTFAPDAVEFGTPTQYYKLPKGLRFDLWPNTQLNYMIRYMRAPYALTALDANEEPELPTQFHRAIVLHGLWWGYRRQQENESAYAAKNDLEDLLRRLRTEYDLQGEFTTHQWSVKMN